jgi:SAM-dependent methyltransferase
MAPIYDEFNAANDYEVWLGEVLLPELGKHGLQGPGQIGFDAAVLDVGCGTGRAFPPLLQRGWEIVGVDASEAMVEQAAARLLACGSRAWFFDRERLFVHDARELPRFSQPFGLILALNDVVNYLTEDGDLELFFGGVKRNLAPGGLVCFDVNTLGVYEDAWVAGAYGAMRDRGWEWTGLTDGATPGQVFEAEVGAPSIETAIHRQRHWPQQQVEEAMSTSGLRCIEVFGQRGEESEIVLEGPPDEGRDAKLVYIGGHDARI